MVDELDKNLIRELLPGLPLVARPYQTIGQKLGISEQMVIGRIRHMIEIGVIRKYGATLNHQKAGRMANAMVVWQVPEERLAEVGEIMATLPEVSHCYQRPTLTGWPYNLYTMIHSNTRENCDQIIQNMVSLTNLFSYQVLYSLAEFKKTGAQYFCENYPRE